MSAPVIAQPLVPRTPLRALPRRNHSDLAQAIDLFAFLALCGFVFAIPLEEIFPTVGGRTVSQWLGLLAAAAAFLRTLSLGRARRPLALHYLMFLLIAWSSLTSLWSLSPVDTLTMVGTYLQLLVLTWLVWELAPTSQRIAALLQAYVLGSLYSSADIAYNAAIGRDSSVLYAQIYGMQGSAGDRFTAGGFNLNDLGLLLALSIPMSVYLLCRRQSPLLQALYWFHLGLCSIAILLTASRGSTIALAIALYSIPLALPFLSAAKRILCAAIAVIGVLCAAYTVPAGVWSRLLETTDQVERWDLSERTTIWSAGMGLFRLHPLAGVGAGSFPEVVNPALGTNQVAHNTFVSVLVELGVVGLILFCLILLFWAYGALRLPPLEKRLWLTILLAWLVGVCSLTWEYRKTTWLILALVAAQVGDRAVGGTLRRQTPPSASPSLYPHFASRLRLRAPYQPEVRQ